MGEIILSWFIIFSLEIMTKNYLDTFFFKDIPFQPYPVYSVSEKGNLYNLKNILYPTEKSAKKFTRNKQLKHRSIQAKMFDMLINVNFWKPLIVIPEFPIIIQNHLRINKLTGGYFLLDYYFPTLRLAVELDSDLHSEAKDILRDKYLEKIGITTFRIRNLEKPLTQKTRFLELTEKIRNLTPLDSPTVFSFTDNIRLTKGL